MHFPGLRLVCLGAGSTAPEKNPLRHRFHVLLWPVGRHRNRLPPGMPRAVQPVKIQASNPPSIPPRSPGSIRINLEKALKGYRAARGKGGERKARGEPRFSYNRQIKSQGGGGFSRSSDLKVGEWKEEEAHLHRSSVRASSGRGSVLLALCDMRGHAHTYAQLNKHGNEVQSRPTREKPHLWEPVINTCVHQPLVS